MDVLREDTSDTQFKAFTSSKKSSVSNNFNNNESQTSLTKLQKEFMMQKQRLYSSLDDEAICKDFDRISKTSSLKEEEKMVRQREFSFKNSYSGPPVADPFQKNDERFRTALQNVEHYLSLQHRSLSESLGGGGVETP